MCHKMTNMLADCTLVHIKSEKQPKAYPCKSSYLEVRRTFPKDSSQHIVLVIGRIRVDIPYTGVEIP